MKRLLILWCVAAFAPDGAGQAASNGDVDRPFERGAHSWSLGAGYGIQHRILDGVSDQRFAFVTPRWSVNLSGRSGDRWTQGTLTLGIEGMFGRLLGPRGNMLSFGPMVRYSFPAHGKWTPYVETAGDFFWTNAAMRELPQRFNFTAQGGFGASLRLGDRDALEFTYRFHHISNAGQTQPNVGVNSSFLMIGFSRFF